MEAREVIGEMKILGVAAAMPDIFVEKCQGV